MKIGFISTMEGCPWGGSELLWSRTAARMAQAGFEVGVSVRHWPETPRQVRELADSGCRLFIRPPSTLLRRATAKLAGGKAHEWAWLRQFRPDLAVISLGVHLEGREAAAACRAAGIPYVLVIQAADENRWPGDDFLNPLRESYLNALSCFFVSRRNLELLETMLAVRLPNATVVRNPFNVRYDADPPWPVNHEELRLACVGTLAPVAKGQDLIFGALARPEWRARPVRLSLYGKGQNAGSLPALAHMLELGRVDFRGFTDDVEQVWAEHHALVLPSRHEGMPLAVVEAMLCGRVCIVTDVAGNTEFIDDGVTGYIAPAPTPPLFREALERAWDHRGEWRQVGAAAARAVRERVPHDPVGYFARELERYL